MHVSAIDDVIGDFSVYKCRSRDINNSGIENNPPAYLAKNQLVNANISVNIKLTLITLGCIKFSNIVHICRKKILYIYKLYIQIIHI